MQTALSSHIQESHKRELEFSKTPSREKEKISTEILQEFEKVLEFGTESNNTDNEPSNIVPKFYFEQGVLVHRNRNGEIVLTDTNNKPFTVGPQNSVLLKLYGRPSILVYVPGKVPSMPVKFMDINGEKHEITKCGIKEKEVIPIVLESVDSAICVDDKNGQIDKQIEVGSIKKNQGHLNAVNKAVEFIEKAFTTVLSKNARRRARNSGKKTL